MPFHKLLISATLDRMTNLQPYGGCDDPNYTYQIRLQCIDCLAINQNWTNLHISDFVRVNKATVTICQKCRECKRSGTIKLIPGYGQPLALGMSKSEAPLMIFDCRGFKPIGFSFSDGWIAESVYGNTFDIDLSEGDFEANDGDCTVAITNCRGSFKKGGGPYHAAKKFR